METRRAPRRVSPFYVRGSDDSSPPAREMDGPITGLM